MTALSFGDRAFVTLARLVEKPALALIPSQKVLRVLFTISAITGQRLPPGTRVERDPDGSLTVTPRGADPQRLLLYIHGGGFTIGSPRTHLALAAHMAAAAGMVAYLPRYPLAPEHPFPAAPDALFHRYQRLCETGAPSAIAGDSAGATLALLTLQRARDAGLPLPARMGLIGPAAELTGAIEERVRDAPGEYLIPGAWAHRIREAYLAGADPEDPAVSPLRGDLGGLPPTLIQAADGEALAQDARRLADALPRATLDLWPGLQHVWHIRAGRTAAATRAVTEMGAFLGQVA